MPAFATPTPGGGSRREWRATITFTATPFDFRQGDFARLTEDETMKLKTTPFDPADFLDTEESQIELLADAVETGDSKYIANALGTIARARGMTRVAQEAGLTRQALYRSLSKTGDPRLTTLLGVAKSLGLKLTFKAA